VDVSIRRWPIANFVILAVLLICYLLERAQIPDNIDRLAPFVLAKGNLPGLIGYIFLHGSILHLAGNMLFLWVFGNAICVKVGNLAYPFIFLALGAVAGIAHLSLNGAPAIGASGAINGIVGMFLVWFPTNSMSVFYLWIFGMGTFHVRSYWMILFWLVFDVLGAVLSCGCLAYWAHVGGFAAGFGLAVLLLKLGRVRLEPYEKSLLQILGPQKDPDDELGPVAPKKAAAPAVTATAPAAPRSAPMAMSLTPPEGYFVSFGCACGAELRAPRKRAGEEFACPTCSARTKIPAAGSQNREW
jgi:membrane associated rhomboid family serine protease